LRRKAPYTDPKNPPKVVFTNFVEAYAPGQVKPSGATTSHRAKGTIIPSSKRKKPLSLHRGTQSKVGCYQPQNDEITNLQSLAWTFKSVTASGGQDAGNDAVKDAECNIMDYQSGLVTSDDFVNSMGSMSKKRRAQGDMHHECYMKQKHVKGAKMKSAWQKNLESSGKYKKPSRQIVNPPPKYTSIQNAPACPSTPGVPGTSPTAPPTSGYSSPTSSGYGSKQGSLLDHGPTEQIKQEAWTGLSPVARLPPSEPSFKRVKQNALGPL